MNNTKSTPEEDINPRTGNPYKTPLATRLRVLDYYKRNIDRVKKANKESYLKHKGSRLAQSLDWAKKNREKSNAIKQAWKKRNRDKYLAQQRAYARTRTDEMRENLKAWRKQNNEKFRQKTNVARRNRFKSDPKYRAECNWRVKSLSYIFNISDRKSCLLPVFGCAPSVWRAHIEKQFSEEMKWSNHGIVWHIDHIQQLWTFDLSQFDQVKKAMHYTNTRPLGARENMQQQPPRKRP